MSCEFEGTDSGIPLNVNEHSPSHSPSWPSCSWWWYFCVLSYGCVWSYVCMLYIPAACGCMLYTPGSCGCMLDTPGPCGRRLDTPGPCGRRLDTPGSCGCWLDKPGQCWCVLGIAIDETPPTSVAIDAIDAFMVASTWLCHYYISRRYHGSVMVFSVCYMHFARFRNFGSQKRTRTAHRCNKKHRKYVPAPHQLRTGESLKKKYEHRLHYAPLRNVTSQKRTDVAPLQIPLQIPRGNQRKKRTPSTNLPKNRRRGTPDRISIASDIRYKGAILAPKPKTSTARPRGPACLMADSRIFNGRDVSPANLELIRREYACKGLVVLKILDQATCDNLVIEQWRELILRQNWKEEHMIKVRGDDGRVLDVNEPGDRQEFLRAVTSPLTAAVLKRYNAGWCMHSGFGAACDNVVFHLKGVWDIRQDEDIYKIASTITGETRLWVDENRSINKLPEKGDLEVLVCVLVFRNIASLVLHPH